MPYVKQATGVLLPVDEFSSAFVISRLFLSHGWQQIYNSLMRIIRKYPNRRLYDTEAGRFIKLSDLRTLIVSGHDIRVENKDSGEVITHSLLLQVISEAEAKGRPILRQQLLIDLIRWHDHLLHDYMTSYLERSVALFIYQIEQMQSWVGDLVETGPLKAWQAYTRIASTGGRTWYIHPIRLIVIQNLDSANILGGEIALLLCK